jgi:hypothetical protein
VGNIPNMVLFASQIHAPETVLTIVTINKVITVEAVIRMMAPQKSICAPALKKLVAKFQLARVCDIERIMGLENLIREVHPLVIAPAKEKVAVLEIEPVVAVIAVLEIRLIHVRTRHRALERLELGKKRR